MDHLSAEGKAIYETVSSANNRSHEKLTADLRVMIATTVADSVKAALDTEVTSRADEDVLGWN